MLVLKQNSKLVLPEIYIRMQIQNYFYYCRSNLNYFGFSVGNGKRIANFFALIQYQYKMT